MDLSEGAITKIEEMAQKEKITTTVINGKTYSNKELIPILYDPQPETITVHSLSGFVNYINSKFDKIEIDEKFFILIKDEKNLLLVSSMNEESKKRNYLIECKLDKDLTTFPFGTFLYQDDFAIKFRSSFIQKDKDDTNFIMTYASQLQGGNSVIVADDGITQNVSIKKGTSGAITERKDLKPIVALSPYRTFREIEQPSSEFLFRVKMDNDNIPMLALFEADSGSWKLSAVKNIHDFIKDKLKENMNIIY